MFWGREGRGGGGEGGISSGGGRVPRWWRCGWGGKLLSLSLTSHPLTSPTHLTHLSSTSTWPCTPQLSDLATYWLRTCPQREPPPWPFPYWAASALFQTAEM